MNVHYAVCSQFSFKSIDNFSELIDEEFDFIITSSRQLLVTYKVEFVLNISLETSIKADYLMSIGELHSVTPINIISLANCFYAKQNTTSI